MKKQLTSPCNDCSKLKRFFCLISCKDYDQWHMDQYIRPMFAAPDPVERYTDLDSKDEVIDTLCATINELREDLSLFKAAEQYAKQENATLQATLMDKDREIEELQDFAIWMTGCGYDFCQHEYFIEQRDKLIKNIKPEKHHGKVDDIRDLHKTPVERCDYCKELHDPRIACPEYAATIDGVKEVE